MLRPLIVAAEDDLSCNVLLQLIPHVNADLVIDRVINTHGNGELRKHVEKFKQASRVFPHVVLTDLDRYECPGALLASWKALPIPDEMLLRIAVREVESWLLADRQGLAAFLHIAANKVPLAPDTEIDPKRTVLALARKSRKRSLTREIVPAVGSSANVGPLYNERLGEFVMHHWNIEEAARISPSLARTIKRLQNF